MQISLNHSEINPNEWIYVRIYNALNSFVYYIKKALGIFGLLLFSPLLLLLAPLLYWAVNHIVKQAIEKFEEDHRDIIGALQSDKQNADEDTLRGAMLFNVYIMRLKNFLIDERESRKHSSQLVMKKFFELERRLITTLDAFDKDLQKHLNPASEKEWSQAELEAILPRSEGVSDLEDLEMDALMERYA